MLTRKNEKEKRIARLERAARVNGGGVFFLIWAENRPALNRALALAREGGLFRPQDAVVCAVWPYRGECPPPRYVTAETLPDAELETLLIAVAGKIERDAERFTAARQMSDAELFATVFGPPGAVAVLAG